MAHPPRTEPLRAVPVVAPAPRSRVRGVLVGLGVGLGVGLAGVAIAFSIIAIPLFMLASVEPGHGLDRSLVRTGLFQVAVPFGGLVGIAIGIIVGVWYARGGRLPTDRTRLYDR